MQTPRNAARSNRVLSSLEGHDYALLSPHLSPVDLPLRKTLETANRAIEHVCFVEQGFVSVVGVDQGRSIEIGLIGREGMTGVAVVMGVNRTPYKSFVQAAGRGQQISAATLTRAMDKSADLRQALLRYCHTFMVQTANTAVVNGCRKIDERLARWLLMAHDRIGRDSIPLTHEFLGIMLGVRRAGVTVALQLFEDKNLISAQRGVIAVRDRRGLETIAGSGYGGPEAEFDRVFR